MESPALGAAPNTGQMDQSQLLLHREGSVSYWDVRLLSSFSEFPTLGGLSPGRPPTHTLPWHTSWVMVPIGQYTHQLRGLNSTMVIRPRTVEVSITL